MTSSTQPSTSTPPGEASTLPPLEVDAFLTAAHCEAQLVQMLLGSQAATGSENGEAAAAAAAAVQQSREQHVLDAVVSTDGQDHSHCLQGAAYWADACVNAEQTVRCGAHARQMKRLILSRCPSLEEFPTVVLVQLLGPCVSLLYCLRPTCMQASTGAYASSRGMGQELETEPLGNSAAGITEKVS